MVFFKKKNVLINYFFKEFIWLNEVDLNLLFLEHTEVTDHPPAFGNATRPAGKTLDDDCGKNYLYWWINKGEASMGKINHNKLMTFQD